MKTLFFSSAFLWLTLSSFAQNFQGIAYYSSQKSMKNINIISDDMAPDIKEKIMEGMKNAFETTYILSFNTIESIYSKEEKLTAPKPSSNGVFVSLSSGRDSKYYKNFKLKQYITDLDIFGKEFLVVDSLPKFNWVIIGEEKKIGNYTCIKAQIIIPVKAEDLKEYKEYKKKSENSKTSFFTPSEPKEKIIEAWYTIDIPISNGPSKYWGLPGLILELHDGETTFLCTKIVLSPQQKIEIKAPKNGKKVTQKEFDDIKEKKLNSMKNEDGVIEIKM